MVLGLPVSDDQALQEVLVHSKGVYGPVYHQGTIGAVRLKSIAPSRDDGPNYFENGLLYSALNGSTIKKYSMPECDRMSHESIGSAAAIPLVIVESGVDVHVADLEMVSMKDTKCMFRVDAASVCDAKKDLFEALVCHSSPDAACTAVTAAKRPRVEEPAARYAVASVPAWFRETLYDSTGEARLACFMTELDVKYVAQPRPMENYRDAQWTIDFLVHPNDPDRTFFLEYKGNLPTVEEMHKCEVMCDHHSRSGARPAPIALMYGDMQPPYSFAESSRGLRGYMWVCEHGVVKREDVVWCMEGDAAVPRHVNSFMGDQSWNDARLQKAYRKAGEATFRTAGRA